MLTPLNALEQKLNQLLNYVAQLRIEKNKLHQENITLRQENQLLIERMSTAQERLDKVLANLEDQLQSEPNTSA